LIAAASWEDIPGLSIAGAMTWKVEDGGDGRPYLAAVALESHLVGI